MSNLYDELAKREQELQKMKNQIEKMLEHVPEGALRIDCSNGKPHYYWKMNLRNEMNLKEKHQKKQLCKKNEIYSACKKQMDNGKYIKKENTALIEALAKKDYAQKMQKALDAQLIQVRKMLDSYDPDSLENIYENMHPER